MKTNRRSFLSFAGGRTALGAGALHAISARGREAWEAENGFRGAPVFVPPPEADEVRISSNENPLGPGPAAVAALRGEYGSIMRYPMNARISGDDLRKRIGEMYSGKADNVVLAPGSSEILRNAVRVYTGPGRAMVTGECSYENPVRTAKYVGAPVKSIPMMGDLGLDLDKMAGASIGAGLVFLCNPNNPTGTVHSLADITDFVRFVKKESPYTAILLDEAYYDYVTHPGLRHRRSRSRWSTATSSWAGRSRRRTEWRVSGLAMPSGRPTRSRSWLRCVSPSGPRSFPSRPRWDRWKTRTTSRGK